jgi:hypothetical protein
MVTLENLNIHKRTHDRQNSWWLRDIKGIEISRVCEDCESVVKSQYNPWVFGEGEYDAEEPIEPYDY